MDAYHQYGTEGGQAGSLVAYQCGEVRAGIFSNTFKNSKKSDAYILAGALRFTMNVDYSAPVAFIYG